MRDQRVKADFTEKKIFRFFYAEATQKCFSRRKKKFFKKFFFEFFLWILFDFFNIVTFENYLQIIFRLRNFLIKMIVLEFRSLMFFEKLEKTVYKAFVRLKANQNANKLVRSNWIECFQNPVWNRKTNKMVRFPTCLLLNLLFHIWKFKKFFLETLHGKFKKFERMPNRTLVFPQSQLIRWSKRIKSGTSRKKNDFYIQLVFWEKKMFVEPLKFSDRQKCTFFVHFGTEWTLRASEPMG